MELAREHFVEHFHIALRVHCLKFWPGKRGNKRELAMGAPTYLASGVVKWLGVTNGRFDGPAEAFIAPVESVIERLFAELPKGTAPEENVFAGAIYDALVAAGLSLRIGPPLKSHGALNSDPHGIPLP